MLDWSDVHIFLSVRDQGSFTAAARSLRVDQTTVGRRIAALEAALGARLFRRGRDGLTLTAAGTEVAGFAARMAEEALALERAVIAKDRAPAGHVRLTTVETFAARFLAPRVAELRRAHPRLTLDLVADHRTLSLGRREADLAVRLARPRETGLVGRKLGSIAYALYAAPRYAAAHRSKQLVDHDLLGYDEALATIPEAQWLAARGHAPAALRSNSVAVLEQAALSGAGVAVLPCFLADGRRELVRVIEPRPVVTRELWLVVHAELREQGRIRAVCDWLAAAVDGERARLLGR